MPKYRVTGEITAEIAIVIEAKDEEDALDKAEKEFGGVQSFVGNGGMDKLIGVDGYEESIEITSDVEFDRVEKL